MNLYVETDHRPQNTTEIEEALLGNISGTNT